jgi:cellulose synthase/poly-beta-1,6-N-acetylglucosamine synthase-like glycosyltransferase
MTPAVFAVLFFAVLLALHYVLYPALVILLAKLAPKKSQSLGPNQRPAFWPSVSLIVAAYNESKVIAKKIENSLALDYPKDRLEIIVVSDGSNDDTPDIVKSYADRGVISMHEAARGGKSAALNRAVAAASGEILLFSDANNDYNADAVQAIARHFFDPAVGGVCGVKRIYPAEGRESTQGDSLYWRMESAIKLAESQFSTITNADGEMFALRKSLYEPIPSAVINDDAELTFSVIKKGFRILYEPAAQSHELASIDIVDDFFVKVRMVAGGYQTISRHTAFLLPPRNWFTFSFFAHKILRWLSPVLLIGVLIATLAALPNPWMQAFLAAQLVCYALAGLGWLLRGRGELPSVLYVPFYFCAMNLAALMGLVRFLRGQQQVQWRKAKR